MKALVFLGIFFVMIGIVKLVIYFILKEKENAKRGTKQKHSEG